MLSTLLHRTLMSDNLQLMQINIRIKTKEELNYYESLKNLIYWLQHLGNFITTATPNLSLRVLHDLITGDKAQLS